MLADRSGSGSVARGCGISMQPARMFRKNGAGVELINSNR